MSDDKFKISNEKFQESVKMIEQNSEIVSQLNDWAHTGSKTSLEAIRKFIENEKDEGLRGYAQCALEECEYFYYSPNNPQEERDFDLAKIIIEKEERIFSLESKAEAAEFELRQLELEKAVNDKLAISAAGKLKNWQYNFSEDFQKTVVGRLEEIKNEIEYLEAWISQARKMIKTEKFKNVPFGILEHFHHDFEGENFWIDGEDEAEEIRDLE